jgi:hypothetical protein
MNLNNMEEVNKNTELDNTDKKLHISDVSDSYAIASLNLMIQRLNNIKNEIRKGKNHIAKQTWKDFKLVYDMQHSKQVDDFFNNYH